MHILKHTEAMYVDSQLDRTVQTTDMWVRCKCTYLAYKIKLYNLIRMLSLLKEIQAYVKIKDLSYIYTSNEVNFSNLTDKTKK